MSFSDAVQWWGEWQLRILVLGSLFLQYFLFFTAGLRKRRIPPWLRFLIWLAYLGSDAIAIYALATLLSNQRKREWKSMASKSADLEALWAPVMLLHLGGRDGITAFSIEDNELWKRHVLVAASQIAVAIYVFWKSLPMDIRLFQATIVTFVPGILKCLEKPWALNRASIYNVASTSGSEVSNDASEDFNAANMKSNYSLDNYVDNTVNYLKGDHQGDEKIPYVIESPYKLFVDLSYSYEIRLNNLKYMLGKSDHLNEELYPRLFKTFERFYTKRDVYKNTLRGHVVRTVTVVMTFVAIALFHSSQREAFSNIDVNVTYVLLCCTASLEFISAWLKPCHSHFLWMTRLSFPEDVAQYNVIWYLASRRKKHDLLRWLASMVGCKDRIDRLCCMEPCKDEAITKHVHDHIVNNGWKKAIQNAVTYRRFNDNRGQLTLETYLPKKGGKRKQSALDKNYLYRSIRRPFDESVLLWHLATDFCFYKQNKDHGSPKPKEAATQPRKISNYMAYLLFVHPEMLMPGTRRGLFKAAYIELRAMLDGSTPQHGNEEADRVGRIIVCRMDEVVCRMKEGTHFVPQAWELAQELMSLGEKKGEEAMWKVIQGVWVEMLCFSAGRCRGYLHAKSLGKGGEYLSCVWLLLWYMGMETFAVRLQRTGINEEGDMSAAVLAESPVKKTETKSLVLAETPGDGATSALNNV